MHLTPALAVLSGLVVIVSAHVIPVHRNTTGFDSNTASLDEFARHAHAVAMARIANSTGPCRPETVRVRKLFENLSGAERIAYTSALNCLMSMPAKTPARLVPGAKTRYDDFVATHINQTGTIHSTAAFLGWHRWFTFEMEQALRNECGYTGTIPYWDWTKTAKEGFNNSAMVDGSATSLSGNGLPVPHSPDDVMIFNSGPSEVRLPLGTGGGCVTTGPFANLTVNLGPDGLVLPNNITDATSWKFQYNPRCLRRSFTDEALTRHANETSVLNLLRTGAYSPGPEAGSLGSSGSSTPTPNIWEFETWMQGRIGLPELGVHGGGHYALGGDPGRDVYVSPGDPIFYSHHANIDRVWWMWQMLDPETRVGRVSTAIRGTLTDYTKGGTDGMGKGMGNGTLEDVQNLGWVREGKEVQLGELLDAGAGMFCVVYE